MWPLFAALGPFVAGAAVSITHGVQELITPEPATDLLVGYIGDDAEAHVAVRLRDLEARVSSSPAVVDTTLSLSAPDEPSPVA